VYHTEPVKASKPFIMKPLLFPTKCLFPKAESVVDYCELSNDSLHVNMLLLVGTSAYPNLCLGSFEFAILNRVI
jgi:hypothetical protein